MGNNFKVTYKVTNGKGRTETISARVEFDHTDGDYGNGYHMAIISPNEPFGLSAYDLRYDTRFSKDSKIGFLARFFEGRYNGECGAWLLKGISIEEEG